MTTRDEHHEAVGFAGQHIEGELLPLILAARERLEESTGLVLNAVGQDPNSDAARSAIAFVAGIADKLEECADACHGAIAELNRYGGGF